MAYTDSTSKEPEYSDSSSPSSRAKIELSRTCSESSSARGDEGDGTRASVAAEDGLADTP